MPFLISNILIRGFIVIIKAQNIHDILMDVIRVLVHKRIIFLVFAQSLYKQIRNN